MAGRTYRYDNTMRFYSYQALLCLMKKYLARENITRYRRRVESRKCSERISDGTKILASLVKFDAQSILLIELTLMIML